MKNDHGFGKLVPGDTVVTPDGSKSWRVVSVYTASIAAISNEYGNPVRLDRFQFVEGSLMRQEEDQ